MNAEAEFRREWEILRSRRERSRRRWKGAVSELRERALDPVGIGSMVRAHPLAAAGVGAAAGALVGGLLLRGLRGPSREGPREAPAASPAPPWTALLRDAAMGIAVPWVLRLLKEKFGQDAGASPPGAAEAPGDTAA